MKYSNSNNSLIVNVIYIPKILKYWWIFESINSLIRTPLTLKTINEFKINKIFILFKKINNIHKLWTDSRSSSVTILLRSCHSARSDMSKHIMPGGGAMKSGAIALINPQCFEYFRGFAKGLRPGNISTIGVGDKTSIGYQHTDRR